MVKHSYLHVQLQSYFLIADDIIDGSPMRRGRPAWHLKDNRGLSAFNDAILLEAGLYSLLKKHFSQESYYVDVLELFHGVRAGEGRSPTKLLN